MKVQDCKGSNIKTALPWEQCVSSQQHGSVLGWWTWGNHTLAPEELNLLQRWEHLRLENALENVSSETDAAGACTFIARILTVGFIFAFQKLFRFSFLTLDVNGVFEDFYCLWNTELSTCLCSVSSSDFDLSHIYVSTCKKQMTPHIQWLHHMA